MGHAVRQNRPGAYDEFATSVNDQTNTPQTPRGLLESVPDPDDAILRAAVESTESIVQRFFTTSMSFGTS
ncbi:hypothetical protein [Salinibacter altiplanensis]|uniref:hypothetical protein n=1 Tax=Salinibacter altiplanensis TaxID=1803181 RepID=UPI000C9F169E|nr:hypothetical protein [Salinibacter altiplanensis]